MAKLGALFAAACGVAALAASDAAAACATDLDCYLNGDCVAGACVCDAAWDGPQCNVLAELEAVQLWPPPGVEPANASERASSWGATILQGDDGLFHAWAETNCAQWMHVNGTVIVHLTAASLEGPYAYVNITAFAQSINPHAVRAPDGTWLLLFAYNASAPPEPTCTGAYGTPHAVAAPPPAPDAVEGTPINPNDYGPPVAAYAASPYGPWALHTIDIALTPADMLPNPNPSLLPPANASDEWRLAFTTMPAGTSNWGTERVSVAAASSWAAPVFRPVAGDILSPAGVGEDPHIFRTKRGLHLVYHAMDPNANISFTGVGGYAASVDGLHWNFSPTPIYTRNVTLANGTTVTFARRERPEFVLDPATGEITHLLTGVEPECGHTGCSSWSIATRVRRPSQRQRGQ